MKKLYKTPKLVENSIELESIFAASGDGKCSRGRNEFNPGADECQRCLGVANKHEAANFSCPQGMPRK